jgi:hypothetical protein
MFARTPSFVTPYISEGGAAKFVDFSHSLILHCEVTSEDRSKLMASVRVI